MANDKKRLENAKKKILDKVKNAHAKTGGYDLEMIRDFLDHLLLEVRVQHFENLHAIKEIKDDPDKDYRAEDHIEDGLAKRFMAIQKKHPVALIAANAVDGEGVTKVEELEVTLGMLMANSKKRDEQIGHLEALQELFAEALECAAMPFGRDSEGMPVQPVRVCQAREWVDRLRDTPDYDELRPNFDEHWLTSDEATQTIRAAKVIVAVTGEDRHAVVFGTAEIEKTEGEQVEAFTVTCEDADELQFLVAVVHRIKGRHDYEGNYYDEF